ncbi:E3 ubiquitin-protein ligase NEDD4 [Tribonema minus]|uniref:HECT-type E3 ubiquitin transferase n=1 Tax=Tribonema minus TaxID=303371 RepID=A0A835ZF82_9STRA|nr:E3 ubiquitin-protein ligase NEDD4 [Tribonema minus]
MRSLSPGYFSTLRPGGRIGWQEATSDTEEEWLRALRRDPAALAKISAQPFWQKHVWLLEQLRVLQLPHGAGLEAMRIEVRREHLLEDSFSQVMSMRTGELRRWLRVQFVGEPGVDAGGLEREWFMLVAEALFDPQAGLFCAAPATGAFDINPASGLANDMHLEYFRFTGRSAARLSLASITFSDLELVDAELYRHLNWLRTHSADGLGLDFTVVSEHFGLKEVTELAPDGAHVAVTDANKHEYLKLMLRHRVVGRIEPQLWQLICGLFEVVPPQLIAVFDYCELEHLLCGIQEIDVDDWRRHTTYHGEYRRLGEKHPVVAWFWQLVQEDFTAEERARLLQFITGSSCVPPHGFKALQSNDGQFRRFSICSARKADTHYPRAHTCFNKLDLPLYESRAELEECLSTAIAFACTGFDID